MALVTCSDTSVEKPWSFTADWIVAKRVGLGFPAGCGRCFSLVVLGGPFSEVIVVVRLLPSFGVLETRVGPACMVLSVLPGMRWF